MPVLHRLAETNLPHKAYFLCLSADGNVILAGTGKGEATLLSPDLKVTGSFRLDVHAGCMAVNSDGSMIAVSSEDQIILVTGDGKVTSRLSHPSWPYGGQGGCLFDRKHPWLWEIVPPKHIGQPELQLIDPRNCEVIEGQRLPVEPDCGFFIEPHPEGKWLRSGLAQGKTGNGFCGVVTWRSM
jgi:hypothetical protein